MLKRDVNGERIYTVTGTWNPDKPRDCLTYKFEYVDDPQDTGNRPGVYIEFKESWLNPSDFESAFTINLTNLVGTSLPNLATANRSIRIIK